MKRMTMFCMIVTCVAAGSSRLPADTPWLWQDREPKARLIPPRLDNRMATLVDVTLNGYLGESFGWTVPSVTRADKPGLYILVGDEKNNAAIQERVDQGLRLDRSQLGSEGFRIVTQDDGDRRFVIVTANTPVGLKHGCQELVFFRTSATPAGARLDWPLDVTMKPQFPYRGVYVLPCWAAHDSHASWTRMMYFLSELTCNRVWFWLAGFPLLDQYGGEYKGTDLANVYNVNGLAGLCRAQGMKFYIGSGWFTWHHDKIAQDSIQRGVQWFRDMIALIPDTEGIYLEPAGEGSETSEQVWKERTEAFRQLAESVWRDRPEFEWAIAIGKFNHPEYRKMMHEIDDKRIYWWWCWGDPLRQKAMEEHPLVLRWHTTIQMSEYHGSTAPPQPEESGLAGFATSYDPGQGYGNPWNGWAAMGINFARNFDPRDMPFFSHQYLFRERCWNLKQSDAEFEQRLSRRLFDADLPTEAIQHYLRLASFCPAPPKADMAEVDRIDAFVRQHAGKGTPRQRDTLQRMRTAIDGVRKHHATSKPASQ